MNRTTIIVAAIIGILFVAVIVKAIRDKKKGKNACSCGGNCGACNMCASCEEAKKQ